MTNWDIIRIMDDDRRKPKIETLGNVTGFSSRESALLDYLENSTAVGRKIKGTREGEIISGQARIERPGSDNVRVAFPDVDADYPLMFLAEALSASDWKGKSRYIMVDKEKLEVTEITEISFSLESRADLAKLFYDELVKRGSSIEEGKAFEYRKILNRLWEIGAGDEQNKKLQKVDSLIAGLCVDYYPEVKEKAIEAVRLGRKVAGYSIESRLTGRDGGEDFVNRVNDSLENMGVDLYSEGILVDPGVIDAYDEAGMDEEKMVGRYPFKMHVGIRPDELAKIVAKASKGMPIGYENRAKIFDGAKERGISIEKQGAYKYAVMFRVREGLYMRIVFYEDDITDKGSGYKLDTASVGFLVNFG